MIYVCCLIHNLELVYHIRIFSPHGWSKQLSMERFISD